MSYHLQPQSWIANTMRRGRELFGDTASRNSSVEAAMLDSTAPGVGSAEREERLQALRELCDAQYAATERQISRMYADDRPCCAQPKDENAELGDATMEDADSGNAVNGNAPSAPKRPAARKIDEDDYDDEDDEMEDAPPPPPPQPAAPVSPPLPTPQSAGDKANFTDAKKTAVASREKLEADMKEKEETVQKAMHDLFFTLENDHDAMLEHQKLEESDRQVNAEAGTNGVGNSTPGPNATSAPGKLSSTNLGASSLTLKHLIARIDASRERVAMSDTELRNLMSEVRRNRSKWASEDKIGQEDLYEAAEKVVLDLRAKTEHSTAFLNRVNKREAPHYFEIIKQPMDLGTVMKKLKNLQYKSKAEFVNDLNLIWDNCLKYNSEPSHYLRKHAIAMREATKKLVELIPDITIRDRAEVEKEEAADEESDDEPIISQRGRKAPGTKKARKAARPDPRLDNENKDTSDVKPPTLNLIRSDSMPPGDTLSQTGGSQLGDFSSQTGLPTPPVGGGTPNGIAMLDEPLEKTEDFADTDPTYIMWKTMTKVTRATAAKKRHQLFHGVSLVEDEPALLRSRAGMARVTRYKAKHRTAEDEEGMESGMLTPETLAEDDERPRNGGMYMPEYDDPMCDLPDLPWKLDWRNGDENADTSQSNGVLRLAPKDIWSAPKGGLDKRMGANMKQMQETRKLCSKITVIKQMQMQTQIYANQFQKYEPKEFVEADVEDYVVTEDGPMMFKEVARAGLQRSVGRMFYHAGFEDFQPAALDIVTDIAADYFQKIAKTFMLYRESPQQFSSEEVLFHSLHEMGVDAEALDSYVRDDVERLGTKLNVIHQRMKSHLTEMLRPAFQEGDGENQFNDGSEQFVGGDFAEDIGDDFFGFKELGLDKEFGLTSLSVPLHLLQGRMNNYQNHHVGATAVSADGFAHPDPFEPVTAELISHQIGLIKPFFLERLATLPPDSAVVEDEDLPPKQRPPKPRLPPTGKISQPRKRPASAAAGGAKKKKKPNPEKPALDRSPSKKMVVRPEPEKEEDVKMEVGAPISPESITAG